MHLAATPSTPPPLPLSFQTPLAKEDFDSRARFVLPSLLYETAHLPPEDYCQPESNFDPTIAIHLFDFADITWWI